MNTPSKPENIALAISGASGAIVAREFAAAILDRGYHLHITCTKYGRLMWEHELHESVDDTITTLGNRGLITAHKAGDMTSPLASGSFPVRAYAVIPCSMTTAAAIATGVGTSLVHRMADVAIKEHRPLLIVPREAPLSPIHLRNLLTLSEMGTTILPPMPAFYQHPNSLDDVIDEVVQRALVAMGLIAELPTSLQWGGDS
jgi:4-hydroxy-3-polyprenylbenzoate decarboxylase